MLDAQEIAERACPLRGDANFGERLEKIIDGYAQQYFWNADAGKQKQALVKKLAVSPVLRNELALAVAWTHSQERIPELMLLALSAAREEVDPSWIFGDALDWQAWKRKPDLRLLQQVFERHPRIRDNFARAFAARLSDRHFDEMADQAIEAIHSTGPRHDAVITVLERHLLNWPSFLLGHQDDVFLSQLQQDYELREDIARAVEYASHEVQDLARSALVLWRAVSPGTWYTAGRRRLLRRLQRSDEIAALSEGDKLIQLFAEATPSDEIDWTVKQTALGRLFVQNPMLAAALWDAMDWPRPFGLVLREELRQIEERREKTLLPGETSEPKLTQTAQAISELAAHKKLFGVAFSGGGIRSATFNLGVLQGLCRLGLLTKVDYLSTVSGGGYIGSWLTAWITRNHDISFTEFRAKLERVLSPKVPDPRVEEQKPVRFLREYSNYMTPRLGSFRFDTWTMVAVSTRNIILNQAILVAVLGVVLLIPRILVTPLHMKMPNDFGIFLAAIFALLAAVVFMSLNMRRAAIGSDNANRATPVRPELPRVWAGWLYENPGIQVLVVGNMLLAVYFASLWTWRHIPYLNQHTSLVWWAAFGIAAAMSLLLSIIGGFVRQYRKRLARPGSWWAVLFLITLICASASAGLFHLYLNAMHGLYGLAVSPAGDHSGWWHAEIWGPVLLLLVLILPGTLQVGLMGVDFPDAGREWLSRFRAVCGIYATYWMILMTVAIYGPLLILKVTGWSMKGLKLWISGLTLGWVLTTLGGIFAGKSRATGPDKEGNPRFSLIQGFAKLAPIVFIIGLILLIATAEHLLLSQGTVSPFCLENLTRSENYWKGMQPWQRWGDSGWLVYRPLWLLLGLGVAATILAWRVDINEFSMHHFYKNRLVRCYLGASRDNRSPNPFTGFDGGDDFPLSELRAIPLKRRRTRAAPTANEPQPYIGPYPIVNTTLNLSAGKQLAWQERKGASFIFTPCFCGFDVAGWETTTGDSEAPGRLTPERKLRDLRPYGFRSTEKYAQAGGPYFGTSISISGAAANPNQGYNTSSSVSFLMTMFNVRLGWWLGNPRREKASKLASPRFGLAALLSELLGKTDDETRFVNLSDGGHFENMGLYELVRRRCSFILVCDAEQDREYKFEGLGSAIRKCRIDFGAIINIDLSAIKPKERKNVSEGHCAVGQIRYLDGSRGILVYIKSSLTGDEPGDVAQYHSAHSHFPHESTADQWFGESQFESYRALGHHAIEQTLSVVTNWLGWNPLQPELLKLFEALEKEYYPINPNLTPVASKHTGTLTLLLERIRQNPDLHALGAELFPGAAIPTSGWLRKGRKYPEEFYFSMCILQLVEDLYFDLQLYRDKWFDDPRIGGWRHLFKTWKGVPAVASAWEAAQNTFREDFRLFWRKL